MSSNRDENYFPNNIKKYNKNHKNFRFYSHLLFRGAVPKKDLIMMLKISTLSSTGIMLHFFTCLRPSVYSLDFSKGLECLMKYYLPCKYFPVNIGWRVNWSMSTSDLHLTRTNDKQRRCLRSVLQFYYSGNY